MINTIVLEFPAGEAVASLLSPWLNAQRLGKRRLFPRTELKNRTECLVKCRDDKGLEVQLDLAFKHTSAAALKFTEFSSAILPYVRGLDHTGIVLPESCVRRNKMFFNAIAGGTACFRDKDCGDWLFVVPASKKELELRRFNNFSFKRQPKFEIVLVKGLFDSPYVQIDLETDLTQREAAAMFPAPYGFGLAGLEQYFRSVWVEVSSRFAPVRFDLRYKGCVEINDWNSGAHLMRDSIPFENPAQRSSVKDKPHGNRTPRRL